MNEQLTIKQMEESKLVSEVNKLRRDMETLMKSMQRLEVQIRMNTDAVNGLQANRRAPLQDAINEARQTVGQFVCPLCNARMIARKGPSGYFAGCSNYPKCTGSRSLDGSPTSGRKRRDYVLHDSGQSLSDSINHDEH